MFLKSKSIIALFVCFAALAQACRYERDSAPELTLTHEVSPQPPRANRPLTIVLSVSDASGKPATGIRMSLEGNMSHAGMTPVWATIHETEPGRYSSPTMELSMAGDWQFVVHITLPDGRQAERQFEIKGVVQP